MISLSNDIAEHNVIKVCPAMGSEPAHFDTAIILQGDDAEAIGVQSKYIIASLIPQVPTNANFTTSTGVHVSHIKVIFKLLQTIYAHESLNVTSAPVVPRPSSLCGVVCKPPCICRPHTHDVQGMQTAPMCGWHASWGDHLSQHDQTVLSINTAFSRTY